MKLFRYLAIAALTSVLSLPVYGSSEAANVAVLPLVNNIIEKENLDSVYFDRAVEAVKLDTSLEIIDNAQLDAAIAKNVKPQQLPDKAACAAIAEAANVDYIFVMQADTMSIKELYNQGDNVMLNFTGRCVSYNAQNGKFVDKKIVEEDKIEGLLLARYDMSTRQFANSVTREVKKAFGIKKVGFEKPRIGSLKGDRR